VSPEPKPILWLRGEIKTPPFSVEARREAGFLLRLMQDGEPIGMPRSRPMPSIGPGCHELRIQDRGHSWRIICCVAKEAIVILDVFAKTTRVTPKHVIEACRRRLRQCRKDMES
jgi:phage-related protein